MKSLLKLTFLVLFIGAISFSACRKDIKRKDCIKKERFDCKELKLNFKDKCKTRDGKYGFVNRDCKCEVKEEIKFDCERLKANVGDKCKTRDGKVGTIDRDCNCTVTTTTTR